MLAWSICLIVGNMLKNKCRPWPGSYVTPLITPFRPHGDHKRWQHSHLKLSASKSSWPACPSGKSSTYPKRPQHVCNSVPRSELNDQSFGKRAVFGEVTVRTGRALESRLAQKWLDHAMRRPIVDVASKPLVQTVAEVDVVVIGPIRIEPIWIGNAATPVEA